MQEFVDLSLKSDEDLLSQLSVEAGFEEKGFRSLRNFARYSG